jgi:hypothetical protein
MANNQISYKTITLPADVRYEMSCEKDDVTVYMRVKTVTSIKADYLPLV